MERVEEWQNVTCCTLYDVGTTSQHVTVSVLATGVPTCLIVEGNVAVAAWLGPYLRIIALLVLVVSSEGAELPGQGRSLLTRWA